MPSIVKLWLRVCGLIKVDTDGGADGRHSGFSVEVGGQESDEEVWEEERAEAYLRGGTGLSSGQSLRGTEVLYCGVQNLTDLAIVVTRHLNTDGWFDDVCSNGDIGPRAWRTAASVCYSMLQSRSLVAGSFVAILCSTLMWESNAGS